ncbi:ribonuclease D [Acinetobacter larvae]|uniref:Ribonuclease D n=1 Tax=Acinetobacter larvae TaxID=1789224 RepID=A0A1B2M041_9GAMM|nr:HRDC domain-containing protein [Acinetobacter larvae]AOA58548.1 ribonuclease D [Acinetobacter larvae]
MFQFIQQQTELDQVLNLMSQHSIYGIDTEFIKVDTFWPKLGVLQININEQVFLLDGTSLDLSTFWHKVFQAQQNIFHACSEDIDLIYYYSNNKKIENVFDTQIAMSYLGYGLQVSYQNALKHVLNIDIAKDQTRSDWLARPLSSDQLQYAANDVLYITQLAEQIKSHLVEKQLYDFVLEDCKHLAYEIAQEVPQDKLFTEVGNYRHTPKQLMQLQQLSVWREQMVKALNQPRSFILKNATMIDLVEKRPKNNFQLSQIKGMRPVIVREYGKIILDLLNYLPEPDKWPLRLARPIKQSSQGVTLVVDQLIAQVSEQIHVPKEVLMRKKWLNQLYQYVVFQGQAQDLSPYLLGWRHELLTQPIITLLQQDVDYLSRQMKLSD